MATVSSDHKHYWLPDALCAPRLEAHAIVLFRCRDCKMIAYGHAVPDEIRQPAVSKRVERNPDVRPAAAAGQP